MPRLQLNIPDELMDGLVARAGEEDRDRDRVVVRALTSYLRTDDGVVRDWPPVPETKQQGISHEAID